MTQEEREKLQDAFPNEYPSIGSRGMTLRDYFANSAMRSILISNNYDNCLGNNGLPVYDFVAEQSYKLADAMLKQREL